MCLSYTCSHSYSDGSALSLMMHTVNTAHTSDQMKMQTVNTASFRDQMKIHTVNTALIRDPNIRDQMKMHTVNTAHTLENR